MSNPTLRLLSSSCAALAIVGAALLLLPTNPPPATMTAATESRMAAAPAQLPAAGSAGERHVLDGAGMGLYSAQPGAAFTFALDDRNATSMTAAQSGEAQQYEMHIAATAIVQVLARQGDLIAVRAAFRELAFLDGNGRQRDGDATAARLGAAARTEVLMCLGNDGGVRGYRFASELAGDQRNFLRGILSAFAFTVPDAQAERWQAKEADSTGAYLANYERLPPQPGVTRVRRTKIKYESMGNQAQVPAHELAGGAVATFASANAWLSGAEIDERFTCTLPLFDMRVTNHRRARLELTAATIEPVQNDADAIFGGTWAAAAGNDEDTGAFAAENERRRWQRVLDGVTLPQMLTELAAVLAADPVDRAALDRAFERLEWLVRLHPELAEPIAAEIIAQAITGSQANVALAALGAAGLPQAQHALLAVRAAAGLPAAVRDAACMAMLQLHEPLPELVQWLAAEGASPDLDGQSALLTMGSLAPRCKVPAGGVDPLATLMAMEPTGANAEALTTWLRAVGNSGAPAAVEVATRHLASTDPSVRAAACDAIRRVASAKATQLLLQSGIGDADANVRRAAIDALADRDVAAATIRSLAATDPDANVRCSAISAMNLGGLTAEELATLTQVAATDADPRLRQFAERLLRGG